MDRVLWSIRERQYPMPEADWTTGDLLRQATYTLESLTRSGILDDERTALHELIGTLCEQDLESPMRPADAVEWLRIRELGH